MNKGCPNKSCQMYLKTIFQKKDGKFYRRDDRHFIQRYKCNLCQKKYSHSTHTLEYKQKKRTMNQFVRADLASGVSMRRCAYKLGINRTTVSRKLIYLAKKARLSQQVFLSSIQSGTIKNLQFDDLITSVHTKLKPLAISVVVDPTSRLVLGASVSEIPAFGVIAKISRKKYGRRKNQHPKNLEKLLNRIRPLVHPNVLIKTDEHKIYPQIIKREYPYSTHRTFKGQRASIAGFGELKTKGYDPLFKINHTLAMLRANINRLFRRTWCTSKDQYRLQDHVDLFIDYFNQMLLEKMEC